MIDHNLFNQSIPIDGHLGQFSVSLFSFWSLNSDAMNSLIYASGHTFESANPRWGIAVSRVMVTLKADNYC